MKMDKLKKQLREKRARDENKIRRLEQEGRAGVRYTAMLPDIPFLIVGLLCDVGWIVHMIFEITYLIKYGFHVGSAPLMALDILSLIALAAVVFGVCGVIYLNLIHEKTIATRTQKNLSFGATVCGGLAAGVLGIVQLIALCLTDMGGAGLIVEVIAGGLLNFGFGLPIFASFKKGIIYTD